MMDMREVKECTVAECAYNREGACRALAITIGEFDPKCDTFWAYSNKTGDPARLGGVGACKVLKCIHNYDGECGSPLGITVTSRSATPTCMTFSSR